MSDPHIRRRNSEAPIVPSIETLMARIVEGDTAAIFALREFYATALIGVIRRQLGKCGVYVIAPDDLDSLVIDACFAIADAAPGWRPGGAKPWWWAQARINAKVSSFIGHHADNLDDRLDEAAQLESVVAASDEPSIEQTYAQLVATSPKVGLLAEAFARARVSEQTVLVMLDYVVQQGQGDRSPASTLAPRYGLKEDTLRQQVSRARRKLRKVVASEPRFAPLADLALVA